MKNIIIAFRSLFKKGRSNGIKIISLAVSLAISSVLISKVCFDRSFDRFYPDCDRIYQIQESIHRDKDDKTLGSVSGSVAPGMFTANFDEDKRNGTSEVVIVRIERPSDGDSSYEMNTNGIRYYGKNLNFDSGNFNEHMAEYNARMAELGKRMTEFGKRMENSSKEIADGNVIIVRPDTIQWADSTTQHENAIIK